MIPPKDPTPANYISSNRSNSSTSSSNGALSSKSFYEFLPKKFISLKKNNETFSFALIASYLIYFEEVAKARTVQCNKRRAIGNLPNLEFG